MDIMGRVEECSMSAGVWEAVGLNLMSAGYWRIIMIRDVGERRSGEEKESETSQLS